MRTYETIFIVHPEVSGDAYQDLLGKYKEILSQQNAVLHKVDEWGTKPLAYAVQKQVKGTFVLFIFDSAPEGLSELERRFRLDESVIKFQSVLLEKFDPSTLEPAKPSVEAAAETSETPASDATEKADSDSSEQEEGDEEAQVEKTD